MVVQHQSQMGKDEAVHKELGDSLVRAATTASNLEAEQDSGNIIKTRSKATPNESSSLGTTSGGGPSSNIAALRQAFKSQHLSSLSTILITSKVLLPLASSDHWKV
ncbi:hypothetical protein Tco_0443549 [Tanacetum coccineum]